MVEEVLKLQEKEQLDASDAFAIIRLLQEQALPILSLRNASVPSSTSTPVSHTSKSVARSRISPSVQVARRGERISPGQAPVKFTSSQRTPPLAACHANADHTQRSAPQSQLDIASFEDFPPIGPTSASARFVNAGNVMGSAMQPFLRCAILLHRQSVEV